MSITSPSSDSIHNPYAVMEAFAYVQGKSSELAIVFREMGRHLLEGVRENPTQAAYLTAKARCDIFKCNEYDRGQELKQALEDENVEDVLEILSHLRSIYHPDDALVRCHFAISHLSRIFHSNRQGLSDSFTFVLRSGISSRILFSVGCDDGEFYANLSTPSGGPFVELF